MTMTSMRALGAALIAAGALAAGAAAGAEPGQAASCPPPKVPSSGAPSDPTKAQLDAAWAAYTENTAAAMGVFRNIPLYERVGDEWRHRSGKYLPLTVDGTVPDSYHADMDSDRPMFLPTDFTGVHQFEGQSIPYSIVGRMPGSNPEVQWVFLARHYKVKSPKDPVDMEDGFTDLRDVAVIGHHPRTGATSFFQWYGPDNPDPGPRVHDVQTIIAPWSEGGQRFWRDMYWMSGIDCAQCHAADPFIHTPWITQGKLNAREGFATPEALVPSNPLGPFFYTHAEVDGVDLFATWDRHLAQMDAPDNVCTSCHRVTQTDPLGLYSHSTRGAGLAHYQPQPNQTEAYADLPWMPPVNLSYGDYYAQQSADMDAYLHSYGDAATEVIAFAGAGLEDYVPGGPEVCAEARAAVGGEVPPATSIAAPPEEMRRVMIQRDGADQPPAAGAVIAVDARMRANTDAALAQWRFVANDAAGPYMTAAPVILRPVPDATGEMQVRVIHVGDKRGAADGGAWLSLKAGTDAVHAAAGDYLGLLLFNDGVAAGEALVPYSDDSAWAAPKVTTPQAGQVDAILTFTRALTAMPKVGDVLILPDGAHRTYSYEFQADLYNPI
ncbi:hypothetical protein ACQ5SO_00110 [Rhodovulum sp. DZ06]|uniref:hypothetical protein n=1 Tax=Rhodovulum sp. DZ06 TaxID=3425126 RepID=UPI003D33A482